MRSSVILNQNQTDIWIAQAKGEPIPRIMATGKKLEYKSVEHPERVLLGRNLLWNADFRNGAKGWQKAKDSDYLVGIDLNENYILEHYHTLYIRAKPDVIDQNSYIGCRYIGNYDNNRMPVIGGACYELNMLVGLIRCNGFAEFIWFDDQGSIINRDRHLIEHAGKSGGISHNDYSHVTKKANAPTNSVELALVMGVDSLHLKDGQARDDSDVACFIAQPQLYLSKPDLLVAGFQADDSQARALHQRLSQGDEILSINLECHSEFSIEENTYQYRPSDKIDFPELGLHKMPVSALIAPVSIDSALSKLGTLRLSVDGTVVAVSHWSNERLENRGVMIHFAIPESYMDGMPHGLEVSSSNGEIHYAEARILSMVETEWFDILKHTLPPHEGKLAPIAAYRMAALESQLSNVSEQEDPVSFARQTHHCYEILQRGFPYLEDSNRKPLRFPKIADPKVSIIIPAHNKINVTYSCLAALLFAPAGASYEVILVDDGSTDETRDIGDIVEGVKILRHEQAKGFQGAIESGAAHAQGEYLLLLNNDTEVTINWIAELLWPFENWPDVGATGAKLIYPDSRLQDGGGVVRAGGKPWNYGRLKPAAWPGANYTRDVDYLTGAALMVRRSVWEDVGGFSPEFSPAYYEDTDLAFKIREAGLRTIYAPKSVVVHFEGVSHGRDSNAEGTFKRFQSLNAPKFEKKWSHIFGTEADPNEQIELIKDRNIKGRVLFIDNETPRPDFDAGSYAAIQEIRMFQGLGFKVSFLPANRAYLGKYTEELQRMGVEILFAPYVRTVRAHLEEHGSLYDYVFVTRYYVAQHFLAMIRQHAPQAKILFNNADCHFLREMRAALLGFDPKTEGEKLEEARKIRDAELRVMRAVDLNFSYNDREIEVLNTHLMGEVPVAKLPWVQEPIEGTPPIDERAGIMFLGGFGHKPNVEAVRFLAKEVMPILSETNPDLILYLYGSRTTDDIRALERDNIRIMGQIPNIKDAFDRHRLFAAPLLSGAGIKGKVLSAMAHGIPCLLSSIAAEGIKVTPESIVKNNEGQSWASSLEQAYTTPTQTPLSDDYSLANGIAALKKALI